VTSRLAAIQGKRGGRRRGLEMLPLVICAALAGMAVVACGDSEEGSDRSAVVEDPGPVHVHGLGINPAVWGLAILVAEIAAPVLASYGVRSQGDDRQEPGGPETPDEDVSGAPCQESLSRTCAISLCHRSGAPPPRIYYIQGAVSSSAERRFSTGTAIPVMSCGNA
jgi:hypothetical protein